MLEAALLNAGIPCRLALGRALADDPVVAYVIAALRVMSAPKNDVFVDQFLATLLPKPLLDEARARAARSRHDVRQELRRIEKHRPASGRDGAPHSPSTRGLAQPRRAHEASFGARTARAGSLVAPRRQDSLGARGPPRRDHGSGGDSRRRRAQESSRRGAPRPRDGVAPASRRRRDRAQGDPGRGRDHGRRTGRRAAGRAPK